jgi:hypothetical protein
MSTKAEDSFMKRLLGSVSTYVSRIGPKPVIVIPPNTPLTFPRKITVGLTEDLLKSNALQFLMEFASRYMIHLDFVQVTNDHHAFWELKNKISEKINSFPSELCGFKICSIPYSEGKIHESLSDYAISARSNMLVFVTKQRNLIDSLMHTSVTKKALLNPILPVMVLQTDKQVTSMPVRLNGHHVK